MGKSPKTEIVLDCEANRINLGYSLNDYDEREL